MISGLNQEVSVLGRVFHFQTELTHQGGLLLRTEVFVGGKVVATLEKRVDRGGGVPDDESLRTLMKEHHGRVIERTVERVKSYQARKEGRARPMRPPAPPSPAFDPLEARNTEPPSEEARRAAASAVRVRRIFGKFRLRLGIGATVPETELAERLEIASRGFTWMMGSPTFQEIRVDEQLRCNLVSEQVHAWLAGERDGAEAARIWHEIVTFDNYVAEINNRAELIAFDRQMLTWAAYQVQKEGMSDEILDQLQWVSGRNLELDRLLDRPDGIADDAWFTLLCHVLAQTPAPGTT